MQRKSLYSTARFFARHVFLLYLKPGGFNELMGVLGLLARSGEIAFNKNRVRWIEG